MPLTDINFNRSDNTTRDKNKKGSSNLLLLFIIVVLLGIVFYMYVL